MNEEHLKTVRELFDKAKENFEREGYLFNELRPRRPIEAVEAGELEAIIRESEGDPFCEPLLGTPEDVFGRVEGGYSIAKHIAP